METSREERRKMRAISIMYHDVLSRGENDESGFPWPDAGLYKLERAQFVEHIEAIAAAIRHKPISVFDLARGINESIPLLLTFDDGGRSAYACVAEILEAMGWRGHFLVTANYVDHPAFLTRSQIRQLHGRGHVIGTHSSSHPMRMSQCSWEEMMQEWNSSVEALSDIIGVRVKVGSVPGGHYSRQVAETASLAGIEMLFTSEPTTKCHSVNGCLVLGRYTVQRWMSSQVAAAIASGKILPRVRQLLYWNAKKVTKALGGAYYLRLRESLLGRE
jgi:peptidoglycan/xylan/chitin deacetylase (PgdA/CDA1 family)